MPKKERGFTLVEVIVTVAIMGFALIPLATIFTQPLSMTQKTKTQLLATQLAQQYIEDIKLKGIGPLEQAAGSTDDAVAASKLNLTLDGISLEEKKLDEGFLTGTYGLKEPTSGYAVEISITPDLGTGNEHYKMETSVREDAEADGCLQIDRMVASPSMKNTTYKSDFSTPQSILQDNSEFDALEIRIKPDDTVSSYNKIIIRGKKTNGKEKPEEWEDVGSVMNSTIGISMIDIRSNQQRLKIENYKSELKLSVYNQTTTPILVDLYNMSSEAASGNEIKAEEGIVLKKYQTIYNDTYMLYQLTVTVKSDAEEVTLTAALTR